MNQSDLHSRADAATDLLRIGRVQEAFDQLHQLVIEHPEETWIRTNYATAIALRGDVEGAIAEYHACLKANPKSIATRINLANFLRGLGRSKESLAMYNEALELAPDNPDAHWNRSLLKLQMGDWLGGWDEYEWRWETDQFKGTKMPPEQWWDGTDLTGRTILLHAEQGLGDMIQFVRFAKHVKEHYGQPRIILGCPGNMISLFSGCRYIDAFCESGRSFVEYDAYAPLMGLPRLLGVTLETLPDDVPYLSVPESRLRFWREQLTRTGINGFRVGVAWYGCQANWLLWHRSIPLNDFKSLAMPGVSLISLQKLDGLDQLADIDFPVIELPSEPQPSLESFVDTAAVMKSLDLVICPDTATAHLAGALGVPVWLLLPHVADWRWMVDRDDCPWYPSLRIIRRKPGEQWSDVLIRVARKLAILLRARSENQSGPEFRDQFLWHGPNLPEELTFADAIEIRKWRFGGGMSYRSICDAFWDRRRDVASKYITGSPVQTFGCQLCRAAAMILDGDALLWERET